MDDDEKRHWATVNARLTAMETWLMRIDLRTMQIMELLAQSHTLEKAGHTALAKIAEPHLHEADVFHLLDTSYASLLPLAQQQIQSMHDSAEKCVQKQVRAMDLRRGDSAQT
jgi:hypothetical protein